MESQAILERWHAEPESRPFSRWEQLVVITSQVGEEHKNDTVKHCEDRMLPILREHGVRFVELARRGHLEADGIVVLQDTRRPEKLHPDGAWKLSDELLRSGTVPQFGGEHRCAMKFKAFVIETWLAWEFRDKQDVPVYHVFGYNENETKRIEKSDFHISRHNEERLVDIQNRPPLEIFGFNSEEIGRVNRSKLYDGPTRTGYYPLVDWGWNRQKCIDYIMEKSSILWKKSACSFCPFCAEASKGEDRAVKRWKDSPVQTAQGMLVEYNSLCFNPRGHLYRDKALSDVIAAKGVFTVQVQFAKILAEIPWGFYRVRRIYTAKGKAVRCVEPIASGNRERMKTALINEQMSGGGVTEIKRNIEYLMRNWRVADVYPTREEFFVVAPGYMGLKLRGPIEKFNERWDRVGKGLPMNPVKRKRAKKKTTKTK